jgi:hypothetical protein
MCIGGLTLVCSSNGSLIVFLFERFVEGDVEGFEGVVCAGGGGHGLGAVMVVCVCVGV